MTEEKTLKNEGIKVYEVGYLLLPTIEETSVVSEVSKIRDILEKNNGVFLSEGAPQEKELTYPMTKAISGKKQKFNNAYFGWIKFEGTSDMMAKIKEDLDKFENLLRYLLVTTVKEDSLVSNVSNHKAGKFSFDKDKKESDKKDKKEVEEKDSKEDKKKDEKEPVDKKVLDETIDELVIE